MNKYYLDGVLVVEGKSDVSYLSSFIKTLYFTTNGYDISEEKLDFLARVSKTKKIIVLTDNDQAGIEIENRIKTKINNVFAIKTPKIARKSSKKLGVAETDRDVVVESLKAHLKVYTNQFDIKPDYSLSRIISLGNNPQDIKKQIIKDYRLMEGNIKFLENQLQMLGISPEEIKQKYGN